MSRSGYNEDCDDNWELIKWRGQVASVIRGRNGQRFLFQLYKALCAMPEKKLIENELECKDGVCALGALGRARGIDMSRIDPEDYNSVANVFGVKHQLIQEIVYENDDRLWNTTPESRYEYMKNWILGLLKRKV